MALKIISADAPREIDSLIVVLYGNPSVGKTSLAMTAEKPVLLDFDAGSHRATSQTDYVSISEWDDVAEIDQSDLAGYRTVVIDTAGRMIDSLSESIMEKYPKTQNVGGVLSLQGYKILKRQFQKWVSDLRSMRKHIIMTAHATEHRVNDEVVERIDVVGASREEIYKVADLMGRLYVNVHGRRIVNFDPATQAFGKNPIGLEPQRVELSDTEVMKKIIDAAAAKFSESNNELVSEIRALADGGAAGFDAMKAKIDTAGGHAWAKKLLVQVAEESGLTYDKQAGGFCAPEQSE